MMIASKIRKLRNKRGFSQEYLADCLNISQATLSNLESGKTTPDFNILQKLCEIFEIEVSELFDNKNNVVVYNEEFDNKSIGYVKGDIIFQLPDKLIQQYEERIKELKETIEQLKEIVQFYKNKNI
ncbi:helix-turn-helix domain-containing protein [Myroides indicus]|uniref:Helix-turn-helix protein n=1 Tax=Myroides indicus TaxID=1323422 RepID=A0A4R7F0S6_9FLAO|nr:helix-turn-helix transcriptional regulator [Myroides indicus]TDS56557.1 helix-turn-helix protein [Myroides indicus]